MYTVHLCTVIVLLVTLETVVLSAGTHKMLPKIRCSKDQYGNEECTCPEDPLTARYQDVNDPTCDFFYLCHLGRALKRKCDPYYAFHPARSECIPRSMIPTNICKPLVNCPLKYNRYVEDPDDCTKYYLCYSGRHTHWSCPENRYFDPHKDQCINDKAQAEACVIMAKNNYYDKMGLGKPPPKTSVALDRAKAHMKDTKKSPANKKG